MNGDVLKEIHHEPFVEAAFVPDAALDALYRQAVAVAKEHGWTIRQGKISKNNTGVR